MKVRDAFSRDFEPNACAFGESKWIANKDWKQVDTVYKVNQDPPHARALDQTKKVVAQTVVNKERKGR